MNGIFLIGPKHSGKTSTGRVLAELCSGIFIDIDDEIERQTGKSPRELYRLGSEIFRQAETRALKAVIDERSGAGACLRVIAAGGGIADNPEALALLEENGNAPLVYLDVSAETAWRRIAGKELPPFLDTEDPQASHRALHERRAAVYRGIAGLVILAEGKSPESIAREIIEERSKIAAEP